jgi:two-component system, chemotaxis family, chemotaxis protein CheY
VAVAQNWRPSIGGNALPIDFALVSFLIVDDQPFSRRLVRSMLHGFGSREVYETASGTEALEIARTTIPSIIVTDLIMPDFNGLHFIKMLKAPGSRTSMIPIIVLSGYLTKTAAMAMNEGGIDELVVKPVSPKALYEHVSRVVLRTSQAKAPVAFVQNQRRRAELQKRNATELTVL